METDVKAMALCGHPGTKELMQKQKAATSAFIRDQRGGDRGSSTKDKTSRKSKAREKCNCIIIPSLRSMVGSSKIEGTDELDYGSNDLNQQGTKVHYPGWVKKVKPPSGPRLQPKWKLRVDDRDKSLLQPILSWEEKVLKVLHMIRRRQLTEYNSKLGLSVRTRFCQLNIALFDLDKESEVEHGPRFSEIPDSEYWNLDHSINVISISVAESDVPYPINVYGTVLARDQNDYRCVYLFKRCRDNPQLITQMDDTLTLTGPYRALSGLGSMFFEFHLKIRGARKVDDQDFSKGLLQRDACCDTDESRTLSLKSCLSTVDMLYTPIPLAVQASIEVNILNGKSKFIGKITASTGADKNKIILYDSEVAGTELNLGSGGSVSLTRSIVSVALNENLVLKIYVSDDADGSSEKIKLVLGHSSEEFINRTLGPYDLQLKIIWTGVFRQKPPSTWKEINHILVLS